MIFRLCITLVVGGAILLEHILLKPRGPLVLIYGLAAFLALFILLLPLCVSPRRHKILIDVGTGLFVVFCLVLTGIIALLSPDQAFEWWRAHLGDGGARGGISLAFMLAFLSCGVFTLRILVHSSPWGGLLFFGLSWLVLWGLAWGNPLLAGSGLGTAFLWVLVRLYRSRGGIRALPVMLGRIALLALVPLVLGIMGMNSPRGNQVVNNLLQRGTRQWLAQTFPGLPSGLAIPSFGSGRDAARIDQIPVLGTDPVFTAQGSPGTFWYIKVREFENLGGGLWHTAPRQEIRKEGAALTVAQAPEGFVPTLRLQVKSDYFPGLPRMGNQDAVLVQDGLAKQPPLWSLYGNMEEYPVEPVFAADSVIYIMAGPPSGLGISPDYRSRCLEIPADYHTAISNFTNQIFASRPPLDDLEYIRAIQSFLLREYHYSLKAAGDQEGAAFYRYFLETSRTGWCSHFATTVVLAARLRGLPARYVQGYTVGFDRQTMEVDIPGTAAHAWAEVYFGDSGWQRIEATPPWIADHGLFDPSGQSSPLAAAPRARESSQGPADRPAIDWAQVLQILYPFVLSVIAAALGLFIFLRRNYRVRWNRLIRKMDRICLARSIPSMSSLGLGEWTRRYGAACPGGRDRQRYNRTYSATFRRFYRVACEIAWKPRPPHAGDLALARRVLRILGLLRKGQKPV